MPEDPDEQLRAALDGVNAWRATIGSHLERRVAPIYRDGLRHPLLVGSGVLVRLDDLIFLVSAAHVADDIQRDAHYFGAGGVLLPLPPARQVSVLPESGDRGDDRIDLAHWIVDPETAKKIPSADTIFPEYFDAAGQLDGSDSFQYLIQGYPFSRQPRSFDGKEWGAKAFTFVTNEMDAADYSAAMVDSQQNLFLDYEKHAIFRDGSKVVGPDLHGVSGGAVWRLSGPGATLDAPLLSGIVISWRGAQAPLGIIATRLVVWLRRIAESYASARPALRRGFERQRSRLT